MAKTSTHLRSLMHRPQSVGGRRLGWIFGLLLTGMLTGSHAARAFDLGYSGRVTHASGAPLKGPVDITVRFFDTATGGTARFSFPAFPRVPLIDGIFQLTLSLSDTQVQAIFGDGSRTVFIEGEAAGTVYPRQQFLAVPLALRVPIDHDTLTYEPNGVLAVDKVAINHVTGLSTALAGKADSNVSLAGDVSGTLSATSVDKIKGVSVTAPLSGTDAGKYLKYDGTSFVLSAVASGTSGSSSSQNLADLTNIAAARTNLGLGTLATASSVTSSDIADGTITDADISGTAAIADTKLATISTAGKVSGNAITSGTIGGSTVIATSGQLSSTGNIRLAGTGITPTELRFGDSDDSNYLGFKSPATVTANMVWTLPAADGAANTFLSTSGSGTLSWISPTINVASQVTGTLPLANGGTGASTDAAARANLGAAARGANSDITSLSGLTTALSVGQGGTGANLSSTGGTGQYLKQSTTGGAVIVGTIPASDITASIGYTPLNKAGDTLGGDLLMGSHKVTGLGAPTASGDAATKNYADTKLGGADLDQTSRIADYVIKWDATNSKYVLAADQTGSAGGGITLINGLNAGSQTLEVSLTGTTPAFTPSGSAHTLNLPLAANASVTAGLISNADYTAFTAKQAAITPTSTVSAGSVTTALQAGLEIKPYASSAGNTGEIRFDELAANGNNFVGFKSPGDLATNTIWNLPTADGTSGQVLKTDGAGNLSWTSGLAPTGSASGDLGNSYPNPSVAQVGGVLAANIASGANAANAATSANTVSTIISRDSSGNFSAGTITATLNGTASNVTGTVAIAHGGTGATSSAVAFDNLSPLTTLGDILYAGASGVDTRLAGNTFTSKQFLSSTGDGTYSAAPAWGTLAASDIPSLDAGKITTGTLAVAQGGTGAATSAANTIFAAPAGSSGSPSFRNLVSADIPNLDAAKITTGTFSNALINWAAPSAIGGSTPSSGAFTSLTSNSQNGYELKPYGTSPGNTGEIRFDELAANGNDYVGFKSPGNLTTSAMWTLPPADGSANQVLTTNGSGSLTWATPTTDGRVAISSKSSNYIVTASDTGKYFLVSGNITTLTLPAAATAGNGFSIMVKAVGGWALISPSGSELIDGSNSVLALPTQSVVQLLTDGTGWYLGYSLGAQYRGTPVSCGSNCYASAVMSSSLAYTSTGKALVQISGVWVQPNGTNVLKVDGSDAWHYALNANGRTASSNLLDKNLANLAGRVCPAKVFVEDSTNNRVVASRCLYYDKGNEDQRLDMPQVDGVTDQTTSGSLRLGPWNTAAGGNGTGASWYEGNIQTCAVKGMRLPLLYETTAADPGGSYRPSDWSVAAGDWSTITTGVPSVDGAYTWTSSAWTGYTDVYWAWAGTGATYYFYNGGYYAVRCVVP
jgi:hypothetical protein